MAEPLEPKKPIPPSAPGAPLPRIWKFPTEEDEEDERAAKKKKKQEKLEQEKAESRPVKPAKKKKADPPSKTGKKGKDGDGGSKGVLVEETPQLDTYEARQRVRIAVGVGLFAVIALTGFLIYRAFAPTPELIADEGIPPEMLAASALQGAGHEKAELEAQLLLKRAAEVAETGKADTAIALLKRITTSYGATRAAIEAKRALDRPSQNLPLFPTTPTLLVRPNDPKAPEPAKTAAGPVVEATRPEVPRAPGTEADLVLPANPAEPSTTPSVTPAPAQAVATRPLPPGFNPRPGTAVHPSGWPLEIVGDRDGAPMVLIFGSTFTQGRDEADPAEAPAHQVNLSTFYMDAHEVTVRQFNLFERENGKRTERARAIAKEATLANASEDDDRPVVMVSARDASDYAAWAGKRLPTEAQWEAAARTPDGRIHPWGPAPANWSRPRATRQIDPIRSFPLDVSPYGVWDLAGNVWEWTKDWYDPKYYHEFRTVSANNPTGPTVRPKSAQLVVKGTSKEWLASRREGLRFDVRLPYLGFRCVLQVEGAGNAFEPKGGTPTPAARPAGGQGSDVPF